MNRSPRSSLRSSITNAKSPASIASANGMNTPRARYNAAITMTLAANVISRRYFSVCSMLGPRRTVRDSVLEGESAGRPRSLGATRQADQPDEGEDAAADQHPQGPVRGLSGEEPREVGADGVGSDHAHHDEDEAGDECDDEHGLAHGRAYGLRSHQTVLRLPMTRRRIMMMASTSSTWTNPPMV